MSDSDPSLYDDPSGETADPVSPRTSIVLPAYNEAGNLRPLVEELVEMIESPEMASYLPAEIVVVDDGSSDDTSRVLRDLAAEHDRLVAVLLARNFGQSAALAAGIDRATGEYVVTMDADRQNDPADVPDLLAHLESGCDCVSGWRKHRDDPPTKTIPSAIQTHLAQLTGPDIHDFGCTLKAYRASALDSIDLYGEGHRYIPAKLHKHGFEIDEIVVDHRPRTEGRTKYGWKRLMKGFMDLLFHAFWNRYSSRPLHMLGGLGSLAVLVGLLIGGHGVVMKYAFGAELSPHLPRLIFTVGLVLFGVQLLMFGLLAEMMTKLYYDDHDPYEVSAVVGPDSVPGGEPGAVDGTQREASSGEIYDTTE